MDNIRLILYLSFALVLFLLWERWQEWQTPPATPAQAPATASGPPAGHDTGPGAGAVQQPDADLPEAVAAAPRAGQAPASADRRGASRRIRVRTDMVEMMIDTRGGDIRSLKLLKVPVSLDTPDVPFTLFGESAEVYVVQSGLLHDRINGVAAAQLKKLAPSHHEYYRADAGEYALADGADELRVVLRWSNGAGIEADKIYTLRRDSYLVDIEHIVRNRGGERWVGRQYRQLRRSEIPDAGARLLYTFTGAAWYDGKYNKLAFDELAEQPFVQRVAGGWVAMLQHYFVSALLGDGENDFYTRVTRGERGAEYIIGMRSDPVTVEPGGDGRFSARLFAGPKLQNRMDEIADGLELTTDYGILTLLSKPLFWLLDKINNLVGNWGLAIVLLTVLIKLAFYKLSEASYKSMARMRKLQPSLMSLRERYQDDKERQHKEMMAFYKKEKINPLGGCLPIVVQIPVFIALYWVLLESVELRQAPFMLWINDLSTRDPYFVLPLLMGATMLIQTKLNPTPPDPLQAKVMMALPVIFTVFFAFFPAGLVLYWFVNNLLSIAQQWMINRRIEAA